MLSAEQGQGSLNLEFALKEKQFACIQNIADGRYVMGILPTGYGETLIYTILPRVLDMLPGRHIGWHMLTCHMVLVIGRKTTHIGSRCCSPDAERYW